MGNWVAKFLKSNHYTVLVSDKDKHAGLRCSRRLAIEFVRDHIVAAKRADIVIVAIPTEETNSMLKQLGRELKPETLIIEISSVKAPVQQTIETLRKSGVPVLSIHPMFGPGAKTLKGRTILAVSKPRHREAERFLSTLRRKGARVIPCLVDKHDTLASVVLALPHLMNISLIDTLRTLGVSLNEVSMVSGTTFKLQSLIAEAIYHEDSANEISILANSKSSVLWTYNQRVRTILNIIKTKPERMSRILNAGRQLVESDRHFTDSYERFNAAVQAALV
jgi:prephenate dehydrogenase